MGCENAAQPPPADTGAQGGQTAGTTDPPPNGGVSVVGGDPNIPNGNPVVTDPNAIPPTQPSSVALAVPSTPPEQVNPVDQPAPSAPATGSTDNGQIPPPQETIPADPNGGNGIPVQGGGTDPNTNTGVIPGATDGQTGQNGGNGATRGGDTAPPTDQPGVQPTDQSGAPPPTDQSGNPPPTDQTGTPPPTDQTGTPPPTDQSGTPPPGDQSGTTPPPTDQSNNPPTDQSPNPPADQSGTTPTDQFGNPLPTDQSGIPPPTDQSGGAPPTDQSGTPPPTDQSGTPPPTDQSGTPPPTDQSGSPPPTDQSGNAPPTDQSGSSPPTNQSGDPPPTDQSGNPLSTDQSSTTSSTQSGTPSPTDQPGSTPTDQTGDSPPTDQSGSPPPTEGAGGAPPTDQSGSAPTDQSGAPPNDPPRDPPTGQSSASVIPSQVGSGPTSVVGGVGAATSLITSAIPSRTAAPRPSGSLTREPQGGGGIADAFTNPVTRTKSIVVLVTVVIGLILLIIVGVLLFCFLRRRRQRSEKSSSKLPGDLNQDNIRISSPTDGVIHENVAMYDPSAEILGYDKELGLGVPPPAHLDNALDSRASQQRNSLLDIYGGLNTPYPQDVVDGNGRPLTQKFIMPNAERFQSTGADPYQLQGGLGPLTPHAPTFMQPGSRSTLQAPTHQRNLSALSKLSGLPEDVDPDQPAPSQAVGPALAAVDPFMDEEGDTMPDLPGPAMKAKRRQNQTDSWMTVNTVAGQRKESAAQSRNGSVSQPGVRADYTSVYMRNPFIDRSSEAPPMPAMPSQFAGQGKTSGSPGETVPIVFADANGQPVSGPGGAEAQYGVGGPDAYGVGQPQPYGADPSERYPPRPPSTMVGLVPTNGGKYARDRRSNPFDLEEGNGGEQEVANGQQPYRMSLAGTVKSVQSWLSGIADAEKDRMQKERI